MSEDKTPWVWATVVENQSAPESPVKRYPEDQAVKDLRTAARFLRENASFLEEDGELLRVAKNLEKMADTLDKLHWNPDMAGTIRRMVSAWSLSGGNSDKWDFWMGRRKDQQ